MFTAEQLFQVKNRKDLIKIANEQDDNFLDKTLRKLKYEAELRKLQTEFVNLQKWIAEKKMRVAIIFEGRDAAGKGGSIKRFKEHLNPRNSRVVALTKPTEVERGQWYFRRYIKELPNPGEIVFFDRSWYNRAVVEPVMGFCTEQEYHRFMSTVLDYESMLIQSGIRLIKYYLDIDYQTQQARLEERRQNPLKQWKISPIDAVALEHWDSYTSHRDAMLQRTHSAMSPWTVVDNNDKQTGRINAISDLLERLHYDDKDHALLQPDRDKVFRYDAEHAEKLSR